jgi:hypothetical protein
MLNALNVNVNVERTRLTTHRIYSRVSRRLNEVPSYPLYIQSSPSVGTVLGDFFVHAQGDKTLRGGEHNKTPQAGTPALGGPTWDGPGRGGPVLLELEGGRSGPEIGLAWWWLNTRCGLVLRRPQR